MRAGLPERQVDARLEAPAVEALDVPHSVLDVVPGHEVAGRDMHEHVAPDPQVHAAQRYGVEEVAELGFVDAAELETEERDEVAPGRVALEREVEAARVADREG